MKRKRRVMSAVLFAIIAISSFFTLAFILPIPLGTPIIAVELGQTPPWHIRPGQSVQVKLGVANNAWLLAAAVDIEVTVTAPESFTVSNANSNEYKIHMGTLRGTESQNQVFNLTARISSSPGTYRVTIKISGQNIPQKTLTPEVVVELPFAH